MKPTTQDLARDLLADLAFLNEKQALADAGRPGPYDLEDDVAIAYRARVEGGWFTAIRLALEYKSVLDKLSEKAQEVLGQDTGSRAADPIHAISACLELYKRMGERKKRAEEEASLLRRQLTNLHASVN